PGPHRGVTDRFEPEVIGPECAQSGEDEVDRQRRSQEVENSSATITGSSTGRRGPLEHPGDCKETVPQPRSTDRSSVRDDGAGAVAVDGRDRLTGFGRLAAG